MEHTKHLFPKKEEVGNDEEISHLVNVMVPVVYWLVLFSIVIHGLSIPALNLAYKLAGVSAIEEEVPIEIAILSINAPLPKNSKVNPNRKSVIVNNRFSRVYSTQPYGSQVNTGSTRELAMWNSDGQSPKWGRDNKDSLEIIGGLRSGIPKEFV